MKKKMAEDISVKVIERLTKYLRCLENLNQDEFISSDDLAGRMGFTPAQIRKDLSNFGDFGVRGKGYQVRTLHSDIEKILGVHKTNNIIIIGLGRLGNALFAEPEFTKESFNVVGLFDNSPSKIGTEINGLKIRDTKDIPYFLETKEGVETAILAIPKAAAQEIATMLFKHGVKAILNFAPVPLDYDKEKYVVSNIDLYAKLQELNFWKEKATNK